MDKEINGIVQSKKHSIAFKVMLLTSMYICQTIPVGFIITCLPVILRHQGVSFRSIGFLFLLQAPWALKFLYASWIDRFHVKRLGRRRTWIFPLQWIGAGLFFALSSAPPDHSFGVMFVLLFCFNTAMATNDIAVDGYATDILLPEERPWGNTIQSGARPVGMLLGGGLTLVLQNTLGWETICILLAVTILLLSLPVVLHREIPSLYTREASKPESSNSKSGLTAFLKKPQTGWQILFLLLPTLFFFNGFQMRMPFLTDLGLSPGDIGKMLIRVGYPAGFLGTLLWGWFFHRVGPAVFLRTFGTLSLVLTGFTIQAAWAGVISPWQGALILAADNVILGGIFVWGFTLMMKASAGTQSGTGFAVLSSVFILPPLLLGPLFGALGDCCGTFVLYVCIGALMILGLIGAEIILHLRLKEFVSTRFNAAHSIRRF